MLTLWQYEHLETLLINYEGAETVKWRECGKYIQALYFY